METKKIEEKFNILYKNINEKHFQTLFKLKGEKKKETIIRRLMYFFCAIFIILALYFTSIIVNNFIASLIGILIIILVLTTIIIGLPLLIVFNFNKKAPILIKHIKK